MELGIRIGFWGLGLGLGIRIEFGDHDLVWGLVFGVEGLGLRGWGHGSGVRVQEAAIWCEYT